jgi:uncharacterized protein (DUF983 family)
MDVADERREEKIRELYSRGKTYREIQRELRVSSKTIARVVKGLELKCLRCGATKRHGKLRWMSGVLLCDECYRTINRLPAGGLGALVRHFIENFEVIGPALAYEMRRAREEQERLRSQRRSW